MNITILKQHLATISTLSFKLPNQQFIPAHFHLTELGLTTKHFVDCGGTIRNEKVVSFQIWYANDVAHRLSVEKLLGIIEKGAALYQDENLAIEVEYQTDLSISKFGLAFENGIFYLTPKFTACLAEDKCGIPQESLPIVSENNCTPNSGCC